MMTQKNITKTKSILRKEIPIIGSHKTVNIEEDDNDNIVTGKYHNNTDIKAVTTWRNYSDISKVPVVPLLGDIKVMPGSTLSLDIHFSTEADSGQIHNEMAGFDTVVLSGLT